MQQRYGRRTSGGLRDVCLCGAVTLAAVVVLTTALLLGPAFSRRAVYAAMARPPPSSRRRRRLDDVLSSASTPVGWSSIVSGTEMEFYMQRIESPAPIHSHAAVILASPAPPFWTAVVMGGVNAKRHAIFGQTIVSFIINFCMTEFLCLLIILLLYIILGDLDASCR